MAAVLSEEGKEAVYPIKIGAVDEMAADALLGSEACTEEFFEVERKGRVWKVKGLAQIPGGCALGAGDNEGAEDLEAGGVSEGGE